MLCAVYRRMQYIPGGVALSMELHPGTDFQAGTLPAMVMRLDLIGHIGRCVA